MATPRRFNPTKEREKLEKFYLQLKDVLQATLDRLSDSKDGPSAAMLETVVKSIKSMGQLLDQLEDQAEKRRLKEEAAVMREQAMKALPAASIKKSTQSTPMSQAVVDPDDEFDQGPAVELPFKLNTKKG